MGDVLGRLASFAAQTVEGLGELGVFVLMALEDVFPPIPSEVVLPLAGFLVAQGRLGFVGVLGASIAGSVAGGVVVYAVGARVGEERIRRLVRAHGRWVLIDEEDLDRAQSWFDRHGQAAVVLGRLLPGVRSFIALPAGVRRMPLPTFVLFTAVGAGIWNSVLLGAGWVLGDQWERLSDYADVLTIAVVAVAVVGVGWFAWRRVGGRRTPTRAGSRASSGRGADPGERGTRTAGDGRCGDPSHDEHDAEQLQR